MKRIGVTLVEVMVATMVLGTVMAGLVLFQAATVKTNQKERDRAFALQKALQIMEELKVYAAADGAAQLDDFGQGDTTYSFNLTTENVTVPSAALSDNSPDKVGYRYVRQILVKPLPRDKGARQVTVRVLLSDRKSTASAPTDAKPLATVSNVFKSVPTVVLPSQAYEVFRISMWEFANATGEAGGVTNSYQYPPLYTAYGGRGADYLQNATSGLDMTIRRQISIAAYGRDTYYAPLHNNDDYWAHINTGYPNATGGSDVTSPLTVPFNSVYFRPGMYGSDQNARLAPGTGQSRYFYSTEADQAFEPTAPTRGQVLHANTAAALYENQKPYTFADQNNHALRYIEHQEKALTRNQWRTNTGAYQALRNDPDLTLRSLLDQMLEGKLKNAIIVNDHAEVFPMIPLRNYSDAAKVPSQDWDLADLATMWGVTAADANEAKAGAKARLVTHPYKMEYNIGDTVELRVHPYKAADLDVEPPAPYREGQIVLRGMRDHLKDWNAGGTAAEDVEVQMLVPVDYYMNNKNHAVDRNTWWRPYFNTDRDFHDVSKKGSKWTAGEDWERMVVYRWVRVWPTTGTLKGNDGTPNGGNKIPYVPEINSRVAPASGPIVSVQTGANAAKGLLDGDVIVRLKDIPFTADYFTGEVYDRDGSSDWDNEYFGIHKTMTLHGMNYFPDPYLPELTESYTVPALQPRSSTRLRVLFQSKTAKVVESLTTIGSDDNLLNHQAPNRSRTWTWIKASGGDTTVPASERFQLVGDPRHNPYRDVRDDRRYNRYFGDMDDAYVEEPGDTAWNYYADTAKGWGPNPSSLGWADCDVPRYFELWRQALLNSNAMFGTITADAFKYVVLGGEYNETPHSKRPMTGEVGLKATYNERNNPTLAAKPDGSWYAKPWLGELYPDDRWSDWINGNLPSSAFRRLEVQNIASFPAEAKFKRTRRLDDWGPVSFYNASQRFAYKNHTGNATLTTDSGRAVTADLKALLRETLAVRRTFALDDPGVGLPSDWNSNESKATRTTLEAGVVAGSAAYYKAGDGNPAVAPFTMRRTEDGKVKSAYFLAFTPWNTWNSGNDPMSMQRVFMAALLQGYLDMASPTYNGGANKGSQRIRLLPRIKVTQPEDDAIASGSTLTIKWEPEWVRWDGEAYSRQFTDYGATGDKPTLAYFVKYSENGTNWVYANSSPVMSTWIGQHSHYNDFTKSYATNATSIDLNIAAFKNKQYQIRIEAWRVDPGYEGVHHAYSQFSINRVK